MHIRTLKDLTSNLRVSVSSGEITLINGKWYITHSGLLHIALRQKCNAIRTALQQQQSDPTARRWIFKATVFKHAKSRGLNVTTAAPRDFAEVTGKETESSEMIYFRVYKSQLPVIEQALETEGLMLGSDKSRGYCLEMICADFLAGASLQEGGRQTLLMSLRLGGDSEENLITLCVACHRVIHNHR